MDLLDTPGVLWPKVDDPEELDTRFSKFTPTLQDGHAPADLTVSGADDIINLYRKSGGKSSTPTGHDPWG